MKAASSEVAKRAAGAQETLGAMLFRIMAGCGALFIGVNAVWTGRISAYQYPVAEGWNAVACGVVWILMGVWFLVHAFFRRGKPKGEVDLHKLRESEESR